MSLKVTLRSRALGSGSLARFCRRRLACVNLGHRVSPINLINLIEVRFVESWRLSFDQVLPGLILISSSVTFCSRLLAAGDSSFFPSCASKPCGSSWRLGGWRCAVGIGGVAVGMGGEGVWVVSMGATAKLAYYIGGIARVA